MIFPFSAGDISSGSRVLGLRELVTRFFSSFVSHMKKSYDLRGWLLSSSVDDTPKKAAEYYQGNRLV